MRNAFLTCALLFAGAAFADDPVVMTVGGEDVRLSEVRYHYRKNREILAEPVAPDKYLDMFVLFKMKVADARSEGLDTAASFRNEMAIHRRRLAEPFVSDTTMLRRFVDEAFGRMDQEVEAFHIMLLKTQEPWVNRKLKTRLDSLGELVSDGADFGEFAERFSQDRMAKDNKGYMGFVASGTTRYDFEKALFDSRPGEIAGVIETPVAFHLVKAGKRRPVAERLDSQRFRADVIASCSHPADSRMRRIRRKIISRLEEKHSAALDADGVLALREWVAMTGIDSLFFAGAGRAPLSELEIARIGSEGLTVADFLREGALTFGRGPADGLDILSSALEEFYLRKLVEAEEEWLYANDSGFRNLLDEYRDGTLMFEISSRRVWNHPRDEQARLEKRWQRDLKRKYPVRFRIKNLSKLISSAG